MSENETRVRRSLQHVAAQLHSDPSSALAEVRRRGRIARRRRRRVVELMAAAAVVLLILVASFAGAHHSDRLAPAGPPQQLRRDPIRVPANVGARLPGAPTRPPRGRLTARVPRRDRPVPTCRRDHAVRPGSANLGRARNRAGTVSAPSPVPVAVDARGRIYVSDAGNSRIQVFSAGGRYDQVARQLRNWSGSPDHASRPRRRRVRKRICRRRHVLQPHQVVADRQPTVAIRPRPRHKPRSERPLPLRWIRLDRCPGRGQRRCRTGDMAESRRYETGRIWIREVQLQKRGCLTRGRRVPPWCVRRLEQDPAGRLYVSSCQDELAAQHEIEIFTQSAP